MKLALLGAGIVVPIAFLFLSLAHALLPGIP